MKTKGLLFCLALCLVFVRIYSIDVLETMEDLKEKTDFGKHFPRQGLLLLCWLLSQGKIDQNGNLHLNFDVHNQKPFGFHQYKNIDEPMTFPSLLNTNFKYYTLGNLCLKEAKQLPYYIIEKKKFDVKCKSQVNIERVVIKVQKNSMIPSVVHEVYITQHAQDRNSGSAYVKELTYMIGKKLLKEITALCQNDGGDRDKQRKYDKDPDRQRFQQIQKTFLNEPHLHQFLYEAGYSIDTAFDKHAKCDSESQNIKLQLRSTWNRQARIVWAGIPAEMLRMEMKIGVYKYEGVDEPLVEYPLDGREHGEIDTPLTLTPSLHVQLTISEPVCETEPWKPVVAPHTLSQLFSLVHFTVSNVCSLVYSVISNVCSLVYITVSNVCSLMYSAVSNVCSLVYFVVSNVCSLVYITVSNVCSLVYSAVSNVCSLVYFVVSNVCSLVYFVVSNACLLVYFSVSNVCSLVYNAISNLFSVEQPLKPVVAPHTYFRFSQLSSLVYITVSNVCSLVYSVVSNVCSLVYITVSNACSLVYFVVSNVCSLVYFAVSNVCSLVYNAVSNLSSVVYFTVSSLFLLVYFAVSRFLLALFICAKGTVSFVMFCLQLIFLMALLLLISILVLRMTKTGTNRNDDRSRVPPQFIIVSHGRPGF